MWLVSVCISNSCSKSYLAEKKKWMGEGVSKATEMIAKSPLILKCLLWIQRQIDSRRKSSFSFASTSINYSFALKNQTFATESIKLFQRNNIHHFRIRIQEIWCEPRFVWYVPSFAQINRKRNVGSPQSMEQHLQRPFLIQLIGAWNVPNKIIQTCISKYCHSEYWTMLDRRHIFQWSHFNLLISNSNDTFEPLWSL